MTIKRSEYMSRNATHEEYYGQFVTPSLVGFVSRSIGEEAIKKSKDRWFNDIPLSRWDALHNHIAIVTRDARKRANEGLSLCFTVCVAKAVARHIREQ